MTAQDEDWIDDDELLIEAARYAVKINCSRNRFMSLAKHAWYQATTEAGRNPQTHGRQARSGRHINGTSRQSRHAQET